MSRQCLDNIRYLQKTREEYRRSERRRVYLVFVCSRIRYKIRCRASDSPWTILRNDAVLLVPTSLYFFAFLSVRRYAHSRRIYNECAPNTISYDFDRDLLSRHSKIPFFKALSGNILWQQLSFFHSSASFFTDISLGTGNRVRFIFGGVF